MTASERHDLLMKLNNYISATVGCLELGKPELAHKYAVQAMEYLQPLMIASCYEIKISQSQTRRGGVQ